MPIIFNIPDQKGNANQNVIESSLHSSQEQQQQMLVRMQGERKP
jgi:hypothetical protein